VLFGIAAIPMLYYLGAAVTSRVEAGAAAAILTVSYHHVWFSQNARGYTALLFLALLSTFALVRWLGGGRRAWLLLYGAAVAAGCYAHLSMVLVCVSHAIACAADALLHGSRSRAAAEWRTLAAAFMGTGAFTGLLFAPMVLDVATSLAAEATSPETASESLWIAIRAAIGGLQVGFGTLWGIAAAAVVFGAGVWSFLRQRPVVALLFLLPLPVVLFSTLAMDRPVRPRFVFFAIGFVLLVTLRGAASVGAWLARFVPRTVSPNQAAAIATAVVALGAIAMSIASLPYGYRYPKQDYTGAAAFVEGAKGDADVVAAVGELAAFPMLRYLGKPWQRVDTGDQLRRLRAHDAPVWVIYTMPVYIESGQPALWRMLQDECEPMRDFEGTVAGGTISVRRCP
jgi:hypothetical protein